MRLVHARQQSDVGWRVPADKPVPPIAALLHHPALVVPPDQPRHLRPAQTGHLAPVRRRDAARRARPPPPPHPPAPPPPAPPLSPPPGPPPPPPGRRAPPRRIRAPPGSA